MELFTTKLETVIQQYGFFIPLNQNSQLDLRHALFHGLHETRCSRKVNQKKNDKIKFNFYNRYLSCTLLIKHQTIVVF